MSKSIAILCGLVALVVANGIAFAQAGSNEMSLRPAADLQGPHCEALPQVVKVTLEESRAASSSRAPSHAFADRSRLTVSAEPRTPHQIRSFVGLGRW